MYPVTPTPAALGPKNPIKVVDRTLNIGLKVLGLVALVMASVVLVSVTMVCVHLDAFVVRETNRFDAVAAQAQQASQAATMLLEQASDNLNRPCGYGRTCGTFAQLSKTLTAGSDLIKHADYLTAQEQTTLDGSVTPLMQQAGKALGNLDRATADLHPLVQEATRRTRDLQEVELEAASTLDSANELLQSPQIAQGLANLDVASKNVAATSEHVERLAATADKEASAFASRRPGLLTRLMLRLF